MSKNITEIRAKLPFQSHKGTGGRGGMTPPFFTSAPDVTGHLHAMVALVSKRVWKGQKVGQDALHKTKPCAPASNLRYSKLSRRAYSHCDNTTTTARRVITITYTPKPKSHFFNDLFFSIKTKSECHQNNFHYTYRNTASITEGQKKIALTIWLAKKQHSENGYFKWKKGLYMSFQTIAST